MFRIGSARPGAGQNDTRPDITRDVSRDPERASNFMGVFRPKRNGIQSKNYVCEFILHGKRVQESTGSTSKVVACDYEKRGRAELERAAAGLPTENKAPRLRSVNDIAKEYLEAYRLNHRSKSIRFAE